MREYYVKNIKIRISKLYYQKKKESKPKTCSLFYSAISLIASYAMGSIRFHAMGVTDM